MLFSSYAFLFLFLPIFLLAWQRAPDLKFLLLLSSLTFYGLWGLPFLLLLLLLAALNYQLGQSIANPVHDPHSRASGALTRKHIFIIALILNFLPLIWFKYSWFIVQNIALVLDANWQFTPPALPLGISFYTFIQVAWLTDIYRGNIQPVDLKSHLLFTSCFPYVISGPIVRWDEVGAQFTNLTTLSASDLARGFTLFTIGLAKKAILADSIGAYADIIFNAAQKGWSVGCAEAWLGSICYTFQLYFDFSGYTDMALGLGMMIGLKLPPNFNSPYKSTGIVEFWRRWHITLGTWLRDYLYIPLGGNRKGKCRQYFNLFFTMLLGGIWHGAGWTFLLWGALQGLMLAANHQFRSAIKGSALEKACGTLIIRIFFIAFTFLCINQCWVIFRAPSLDCALRIYSSMFSPNTAWSQTYFNTWIPYALITVCAFISWGCPNSDAILHKQGAFPLWQPSRQWAYGLATLCFISLLLLSRQNTFLYFQF